MRYGVDLLVLADLTQGLRVEFPAPLEPWQQALMDTLGVTVDVQAATSTYDCAWPGCEGEAKSPGGLCQPCLLDGRRIESSSQGSPGTLCRSCRLRPPLAGLVGTKGPYANLCGVCRDETRSYLKKTSGGEPSAQEEHGKPRTLCRVCKTVPAQPGSVGVSGRYGTLCQGCRAEERAKASRAMSGANNPRAKREAATAKPRPERPAKPAATPPPPKDPASDITEAAAAFQEAAAAYVAARQQLNVASERVIAALERLRGA